MTKEELLKELDFIRTEIFKVGDNIGCGNYTGATFKCGCIYQILQEHCLRLKKELKND
jgi:hypothetical protein